MGLPTAEEMADNPIGPPIRVCAVCQKEGDEVIVDMSAKRRTDVWLTCHRCGRRSKLGSLVRRTEADER